MGTTKGRNGSNKEILTINESPAFYKPFLPKFSTKRLEIPLAYKRYMEGKLPREAQLRDQYGNIWPVKIGTVENQACFRHGWRKFIRQNHVKPGDLFLFYFNGYNIFDVKLLGRNYCEKEGVGFLMHELKYKEEEDETIEDEDEKGDESDDSDDDLDYINNSNESEFEGSPERNNNDGGEGANDRPRKRRDIDPFGFDIFKDRSVSMPKNPYFITEIRSKRKAELFIPTRVIKAHKIDLRTTIVLSDHKGRKWDSTYKRWKDGRACYYGGWKELCDVNLITEKVPCICEFLESEDGNLCIKVQAVQPRDRN